MLGGHTGSLWLFGCVRVGFLALLGLASPCSRQSAAPGSCLPEFADPGAFAPEAKLRSWAGGLDFCSNACQLCPASLQGLCCSTQGGCRGDRDTGTGSAVVIPIPGAGGSAGLCSPAGRCGLRWSE